MLQPATTPEFCALLMLHWSGITELTVVLQ
jgi:hypothetical protein